MQNKEKYLKPQIEIIQFSSADIIITSLNLPEIVIDDEEIHNNE
jgi:hypothetical protein